MPTRAISRTRQPQGIVGADRDHPLHRSFVGGFLHPVASLGRVASTGSMEIRGMSKGAALYNVSGTADRTFPDVVSPQTTEATIFIVAVRFGAQPDSGFGMSTVFPKIAGASDAFHHFIKDSGERCRFNSVGSDSNANSFETTEDWVVNQWMVGAYVYPNGGTLPAIYRDGRSLSVSAPGGGDTSGGALKSSTGLTSNLAAFRLNGAVAGVLVFKTQLPSSWVQSISVNPWQIAEPTRRSVVVPSAAAATTFGFLRANAGVGNIGGGPFSRSNAGLGVLA